MDNDYIRIKVPGTELKIAWKRGKCWDMKILTDSGTDTGWLYKYNVICDLVIEADGCLDDYQSAGKTPPALNPENTDIRNEDIRMEFSKYAVCYKNVGIQIFRHGELETEQNIQKDRIVQAMARIVNLLRQDMAANGIVRHP